MPPAARMTDFHLCTLHPMTPSSGVVQPRVGTVRIGFLPAARMGDPIVCIGGNGIILKGEPTVRIEGLPAARLGDPIAHAVVPTGTIGFGCPTVNIGMSVQANTLVSASRGGTPFCEECEAAPDVDPKGPAK
ncbi:PAAR domain-containing protein [Chondromyces crocatus]|uniref:PAAR motif protein n=1 Tax=Chondromyces crocatus TaxID=52 RepID=A0A0K1EKE4_CHOCO|nr:PAAR domain-containing protein [Chondromyces crocatus]AKT41137.1 uncharacterized protein CMC5_052980 [Chondromyces crocatus]